MIFVLFNVAFLLRPGWSQEIFVHEKPGVCFLAKFSHKKSLLSLFPLCSASLEHQTGLPFTSCVDLQVLFSSFERSKTAWFLWCKPLEERPFLFPAMLCLRNLLLAGALCAPALPPHHTALHPHPWAAKRGEATGCFLGTNYTGRGCFLEFYPLSTDKNLFMIVWKQWLPQEGEC